MADLNGETPERLKIAITAQLLPDSRTADLQNIGLGEQGGSLQGIPENATETSTVVEAHISAALMADLDFKSHRAHMGEQLNPTEVKPLARGLLSSKLFKIGEKRMRQWELKSGTDPTCIQM